MANFQNSQGRKVVLDLVQTILDNKAYLSEVDGKIGDGDHGINMAKGFNLIKDRLADNEVTLPIFETVLNGITIVGSIVGTRTDLREVFELHRAGKTHVIREVRPLEAVNEAIADVESGHVAARVVFEL